MVSQHLVEENRDGLSKNLATPDETEEKDMVEGVECLVSSDWHHYRKCPT